MKKKYEINMTEGSILKVMLMFAIPLIASGLLQLVYNAADIVVVGRCAGENSLAAVGSTSSLVHLIVNLFVGLSVGVTVIISRAYGAGNKDGVARASHTAMALALLSGFIILVIGVFLSETFLKMMGTPDEVLKLAALYLKIFFLGAPANMVYNFGASILRALGDTKRPLYYLTFAGIVNVVLNLIFVINFHMDVAGVALATIASQYISAFLIVRNLVKMGGILNLKKIRFFKNEVMMILKIGIPAGIQSIMFSLSNVIVQATINSFGATTVAGNSAAINIEGFAQTSLNAFNQTLITFIGQNIGARKMGRIKKGILTVYGINLCLGIAASVLMVTFREELVSLYSTDADVIAAGMRRMLFTSSIFFISGLLQASAGAIDGFGKSFVSMSISIIFVCVFRVVWIAFVYPLNPIVESVYVLYPITQGLTVIANIIAYFPISKREFAKINRMQMA